MDRRVIVSLIGVLLVGIVLGAILARAVDNSSEAESPPATTISEEDCAEARSVVDRATSEINNINAEATEVTANFFAALLVEQRTVVYAMDARPDCFDLAARAANAGLLDGLNALVGVAELAPVAPLIPPGPAIESTVPAAPEQSDSGAPTTSDESGE